MVGARDSEAVRYRDGVVVGARGSEAVSHRDGVVVGARGSGYEFWTQRWFFHRSCSIERFMRAVCMRQRLKHRKQTAEPKSANVRTYMHVHKVLSLPIVIKIVDVSAIPFKSQIFQSSSNGS